MNGESRQGLEDTALDYVLGSIDAAERRRIARAMDSDPALAMAVHEWQARLAPLTDTIAPVSPPDSVWRAIEADMKAGPLRRFTPRARWAGGASLAAAAAVLAVLFWHPYSPVAHLRLAATDGTILATADIDRRDIMRLHPVAMPPAPAGKVYELWIIPAGGTSPRAEGLMPDDAATPIQLADVEPDATLAVSIEPAQGSPTGAPTGPVVASGKIEAF